MDLRRSLTPLSLAAMLAFSPFAGAHCDTLDGPVVIAARKALDTGNAASVLAWVQKKDEGQIRTALDRARTVRKMGGEARELADTYFFETLVRVHRAGEGADFTGLKPAGRIEPPVAAADSAVANGKLPPVAKLVAAKMEKGLHAHFDAVMAKKKHDPDDIAAARAYTSAYVEFVHYVERLHGAAETLAPHHAEGPAPAHAH